MMPDLGKYAGPVLAAYGGSIFLLVGIIAMSLRSGAKSRAMLRDAEAKLEARDED